MRALLSALALHYASMGSNLLVPWIPLTLIYMLCEGWSGVVVVVRNLSSKTHSVPICGVVVCPCSTITQHIGPLWYFCKTNTPDGCCWLCLYWYTGRWVNSFPSRHYKPRPCFHSWYFVISSQTLARGITHPNFILYNLNPPLHCQ